MDNDTPCQLQKLSHANWHPFVRYPAILQHLSRVSESGPPKPSVNISVEGTRKSQAILIGKAVKSRISIESVIICYHQFASSFGHVFKAHTHDPWRIPLPSFLDPPRPQTQILGFGVPGITHGFGPGVRSKDWTLQNWKNTWWVYVDNFIW